MQNLIQLWQGLDGKKRAIVAGATMAVFLAVLAIAQFAGKPGLSLLYAGLEGSAAGDVVAALEQEGVTFEVRGDSIYVDSTRRDSLRMVLAGQGLPANSGTGYELLDGLSGFGTTSQMFDAAYWRAKEGEIARTILANPLIRAARVHIAQAPTKAFQPEQKAKASVTVSTAAGGLPVEQARALRHLVAAAVPGMVPEDVAVIDAVAGLLPGEDDALRPDAAADARAAELRRNVERLLEARVGAGKAVVEVAVDVVTEREAITEHTFDPQGRVAISQETENRNGTSTEPGGDVTVASNLPDQQGGGQSAASSNETSRETVNYELSETRRDIRREPGDIRRLSVAVLVDAASGVAEDGTPVNTPRSEEELAVLRDLVASAVGLDEARGDVLTLRSLEFLPVEAEGTLAEAGLLSGPLDVMQLVQIALLAAVALVLGLFVIRPILAGSARALPASTAPLALDGPAAARTEALTGVIEDDVALPPMPVIGASGTDEDPVARLRRLIAERQAESVEILRGWMEAEERT